MGIIYKLTSPSSKVYVGQTIRTFKKRLRDHKKKDSCCRKLKEAINEYGFENFKKEILWEGPNNELGEMEKHYIKEFNCVYPNGYNLSSGGGRGEERTESTKELLRKVTREYIIKKNGVLGNLEKVENKNGTVSYTVSFKNSFNNERRKTTFHTEEEAKDFQKKYTENPEQIFNSIKQCTSIGDGGIAKRGERWRVRAMTNKTHFSAGTYDTKEEAEQRLKEILNNVNYDLPGICNSM